MTDMVMSLVSEFQRALDSRETLDLVVRSTCAFYSSDWQHDGDGFFHNGKENTYLHAGMCKSSEEYCCWQSHGIYDTASDQKDTVHGRFYSFPERRLTGVQPYFSRKARIK